MLEIYVYLLKKMKKKITKFILNETYSNNIIIKIKYDL